MKCNPAVATIAIDLAKSVFQVLAVDQDGKMIDSHRLSRAQFIAFWHNRAPVRVVMEACGSAHHFGRWLSALGTWHHARSFDGDYGKRFDQDIAMSNA